MRLSSALLAGLLLGASNAALAQGPEQLDQLEPGGGEWQTEYFATQSGGANGAHALEVLHGVGDRLAVGFEIEAENEAGAFRLETVGVKALVRLSGKDAPLGIGLQLAAAVDSRAALVEIEARVILQARSEAWWVQANAMLRRQGRRDEARTGLAYAASLQHAVGHIVWLGIEASGQLAPLAGDARRENRQGQFAGPSLTFELEPLTGHELEIGIAYLHRFRGGSASAGRFFAQLTF